MNPRLADQNRLSCSTHCIRPFPVGDALATIAGVGAAGININCGVYRDRALYPHFNGATHAAGFLQTPVLRDSLGDVERL